MLQVNLEKIKRTLEHMLVMCDNRISVLKEEIENSDLKWNPELAQEEHEQIKHFELLKEDAKESIQLCNKYLM